MTNYQDELEIKRLKAEVASYKEHLAHLQDVRSWQAKTITRLQAEVDQHKTPGPRFKIINDGPERWVLLDTESDELKVPVYKTEKEAFDAMNRTLLEERMDGRIGANEQRKAVQELFVDGAARTVILLPKETHDGIVVKLEEQEKEIEALQEQVAKERRWRMTFTEPVARRTRANTFATFMAAFNGAPKHKTLEEAVRNGLDALQVAFDYRSIFAEAQRRFTDSGEKTTLDFAYWNAVVAHERATGTSIEIPDIRSAPPSSNK